MLTTSIVRALDKTNSSSTIWEPVSELEVTYTTTPNHLKQIGKTEKLDFTACLNPGETITAEKYC